MISDTDHIRLAESVREIFSEGFTIDGDVLDYVDSTFSSPTAAELESVMTDESDCEHDPLIELVFFPDESVQMRLEDMLGNDAYGYEHFGKSDMAMVLARLHSKSPVAPIRFSDGRGEFVMNVPEFGSAGFLSRLNVANKPDRALVAAIGNHVSAKHRATIKVRLRNARFKKSERNIRFLEKFLENVENKSADLFACLDLTLKFIEETGEGKDLRERLVARKQQLLDNLNKVSQLEAKTENLNIEMMILGGMRIPYANKTEMMRQVAILDEIGFIVFGPEFYQFSNV